MKTIRQWVGGEYYEGSPLGVIPVENPATGEVTAELLQACLLYTSPSPRDRG